MPGASGQMLAVRGSREETKSDVEEASRLLVARLEQGLLWVHAPKLTPARTRKDHRPSAASIESRR